MGLNDKMIARRAVAKTKKVLSLENEIWHDLLGYEGHYQISSLFRIKSLYRLSKKENGTEMVKPEQIRKYSVNMGGYLDIILTKDRVSKTLSVHILMAKMFVPNPNNYPEVNHKDGDKLNCLAYNLEWGTHKYNMEHAVKNGLRKYVKGVNNGRYKIPENKIKEIFLSNEGSLKLAKQFGVTRSAIQRIRNGRNYKNITSGLNRDETSYH